MKEYCPLNNHACDSYYGHYCWGNLCTLALEENRSTDMERERLREERFNRKVEISREDALQIIAERQKCKPDNITIK